MYSYQLPYGLARDEQEEWPGDVRTTEVRLRSCCAHKQALVLGFA